MRLIRMKLKDWRGVGERDVYFKDGVTILEGPNEVGKSSIVAALFMLINDFSSSNKAAVKDVQPVGRDVGSTVEAEISAGKYHFVYKKTFNKGKTTELHILAPTNSQMTGREAHDYVGELLGETVDLELWSALLVDQGEQIAPVDLKNSQSLSSALDAAAAGSVSTGEDVGLLQAAQDEYERYFTLAKGHDKLTSLDKTLAQADAALSLASAELREVDRDAERHQGFDADIKRRHRELPNLQKNLEKHQNNKRTTDKLRSELQIGQTQLEAVEDRQRLARTANADRQKLIDEVANGENSLSTDNQTLESLQKRATELEKELLLATQAVENSAEKRRLKTAAVEVARDDQVYLDNTLALAKQKQLASNVDTVEENLKRALEQIASVTIDEQGFEALRSAESDERVIKGQRDHAATSVSITADDEFKLQVDGAEKQIGSGETQQYAVSTELELNLPGVAAIRVLPPKTSAELNQKLQAAQQAFGRALSKYGVNSLDEARAALAKKQLSQQEAQQLRVRLSDLLGKKSVQDIQHEISKLNRECANYLETRSSDTSVPAESEMAHRAFGVAKQKLEDFEREFETIQSRERELRGSYEQADQALRDAQNTYSSLEATLNERRRRLEGSRSDTSDAELASQLERVNASATKLAAEVVRLKSELNQLLPETIEGLFENADASLERAKTELTRVEQERAIFEDRLIRAKANGRFEEREALERKRNQLKDELEEKRRRAVAARRLWETLNRHRDNARQAYIQPLKTAIENLGRIVFGSDFEVTVNDDWTLSSRTLNGVTLPFGSLSIGTQEQLSILTRLAAAQIVSKHGGVPLIIDDALGFSDPARLETMGAAIAAAGKSCQIIILTCVPERFTHVGNAEVVPF
ncbi:MAG: hypothetical protein AB8G18_16960 [Gammaproteobacteria bacterium]